MTDDPFFGNDYLIKDMLSAMRNREHALKSVPGLLRRIIETEAWKDFHTPWKEHVTHERFEDFLTAPAFRGLGITLDEAYRITANDPDTTQLLRAALTPPQGLTENEKEVPAVVQAIDAKMTGHSTVAHSPDGWRFPTGAATCLVSGCDSIPRLLITAGDEVVTTCVEHTPDMAWALMAARGELWGYGEAAE